MAMPLISQNFASQAWEKLNATVLLEGVFWGSWCGLNVLDWTKARKEITSLQSLPQNEEKTQKVWEAKKKYILSSFSLISGISMITTWLEGIQIINLELIGVAVCALGYGGSAVVSTVKACDCIKEFDQAIFKYFSSSNEREKGNIALDQLERVIKTAFLVAMAFWSIFGALHTIAGGEALFTAMDTSFYYSFVLFITYIALAIAVSALKKKV